jgi:hypothetical protein
MIYALALTYKFYFYLHQIEEALEVGLKAGLKSIPKCKNLINHVFQLGLKAEHVRIIIGLELT